MSKQNEGFGVFQAKIANEIRNNKDRSKYNLKVEGNDIYFKRGSNTAKKDFDIITDDSFLDLLQKAWVNAHSIKKQDLAVVKPGVSFQFFVYAPQQDKAANTTRATQSAIEIAKEKIRNHLENNNAAPLGPAALLYASTSQARLGPQAPVQLNLNDTTIRQLQFVDRVNENSDNEREVLASSMRELTVFIGGVSIPISINISLWRQAFGLPDHDLMERGIFGTTIPPQIPISATVTRDIDHDRDNLIQTLATGNDDDDDDDQ